MAQYKTGTVDLTNASAVVTGTNTAWDGEVNAGDLFTIIGTGVNYEVASLGSPANTTLNLSAPYAGTTLSDQSYVISRDFTPIHGIPYVNKGDVETATILKRAFEIIDGLFPVGSPGA